MAKFTTHFKGAKRKQLIATIILATGIMMTGCGKEVKEEILIDPDVQITQEADSASAQDEPVTITMSELWAQNHPDKVTSEADSEDTEDQNGYFDPDLCEYKTMYIVNCGKGLVKEEPSEDSHSLEILNLNNEVQAARYNDEWYVIKVGDITGYILAQCLADEPQVIETSPAKEKAVETISEENTSIQKKEDTAKKDSSTKKSESKKAETVNSSKKEEKATELVNVDFNKYHFQTKTLNAAGVNVRKGPGTEYDVVGVLDVGGKVYAASYNTEYDVVDYNGQPVFIASKYLYAPDNTVVADNSQTVDTTNNSSENNSSNNNSSSNDASAIIEQAVNEPVVSSRSAQQTTSEKKLIDYSYLNIDTDDVLSIVRSNMKKTGNNWYNEMISKSEILASTGEYTSSDQMDVEYVASFYESQYTYQYFDSSLLLSQSVNTDDTFSVDSWDVIWGKANPSADYARAIVKRIGIGSGTTEYEVAQDVVTRVHRFLTYDLAYLDSTPFEALDARRGVCHHYARFIETILNYQGIPTRTVVGYWDGGKHMWAEATIDGTTYILEGTSGRVYPVNSSEGSLYHETKM